MSVSDISQSVCALIFREAPSEEIGDGAQILLIKRKFSPFQGRWALPGGFIKKNQLPHEALCDEVEKETGLQVKGAPFLALSVRARDGRDPRGIIHAHPYLLALKKGEGENIRPADSIEEVRWFFLSEVEELAFDHGAILCEGLGTFWPGMPSFHEKMSGLKLPSFLLKKDFNLQAPITFYAGSFNPWHPGHRACLDLCPSQNILVVPDQNPWKGLQEMGRCFWKSFVQLASELETTPWSLYPGFWGQEKGNPTVDWLPYAYTKNEQGKWLLMGDDSYLSFLSWKNINDLLPHLAGLYVVLRKAQNSTDDELIKQKEEIQKKNKKLKVEFLEGNPHKEISSTELRINGKKKGQ